MKIVILGGGPAGLYSGLLLKKANPTHDITTIERNPADVTYGWGVVFSDRTLASFQRADYKTCEQITNCFVIWDAIDVHYRGETICCGGHVIASISRKHLLNILQSRCEEVGISLIFNNEADEEQSLAYCQRLFADDLGGAALLSNNSKWISFPALKTSHWHHQNMVLLGDTVHTAHFSIGSGTKLAMEDAIALATAIEQHADLETALNEFELERKPVWAGADAVHVSVADTQRQDFL